MDKIDKSFMTDLQKACNYPLINNRQTMWVSINNILPGEGPLIIVIKKIVYIVLAGISLGYFYKNDQKRLLQNQQLIKDVYSQGHKTISDNLLSGVISSNMEDCLDLEKFTKSISEGSFSEKLTPKEKEEAIFVYKVLSLKVGVFESHRVHLLSEYVESMDKIGRITGKMHNKEAEAAGAFAIHLRTGVSLLKMKFVYPMGVPNLLGNKK